MKKLSHTERKITHLVLCHINEVETRRLYLQLGFDSIYQYLTQELGYSEDAAYDRMRAARLLRHNPQIADKLECGALKLSQLVKVAQSLKQEKKSGKPVSQKITESLLEKIEHKSGFETQKILACELNQTPKTTQRITPQKDESVRLEHTLSKEQYTVLKKAQSLISHSVPENDLTEVIIFLAKTFIQKIEGKVTSSQLPTQGFRKDPFIESSQRKAKPSNGTKRKYISVKLRREVFNKANYRCEYINPASGQKCQSRHQLQLDHIQPLSCGGKDEIINYRVLCGVHNRHEALRWGISRSF
jgi:hypothetical protein